MKTFELKGEIRTETGKTANKKLRKSGKVPCIMYGGQETVLFSVELASLKKFIYTPNVYIVDLEVGVAWGEQPRNMKITKHRIAISAARRGNVFSMKKVA